MPSDFEMITSDYETEIRNEFPALNFNLNNGYAFTTLKKNLHDTIGISVIVTIKTNIGKAGDYEVFSDKLDFIDVESLHSADSVLKSRMTKL